MYRASTSRTRKRESQLSHEGQRRLQRLRAEARRERREKANFSNVPAIEVDAASSTPREHNQPCEQNDLNPPNKNVRLGRNKPNALHEPHDFGEGSQVSVPDEGKDPNEHNAPNIQIQANNFDDSELRARGDGMSHDTSIQQTCDSCTSLRRDLDCLREFISNSQSSTPYQSPTFPLLASISFPMIFPSTQGKKTAVASASEQLRSAGNERTAELTGEQRLGIKAKAAAESGRHKVEAETEALRRRRMAATPSPKPTAATVVAATSLAPVPPAAGEPPALARAENLQALDNAPEWARALMDHFGQRFEQRFEERFEQRFEQRLARLEEMIETNARLLRECLKQPLRQAEDLPAGLPFYTREDVEAFNGADDADYHQLVSFFLNFGLLNPADCASHFFKTAFAEDEEVTPHMTWGGVPQKNKFSLASTKFVDACREAMELNQNFEGPNARTFKSVMVHALKAMELRWRRRHPLRPVADDEQPRKRPRIEEPQRGGDEQLSLENQPVPQQDQSPEDNRNDYGVIEEHWLDGEDYE